MINICGWPFSNMRFEWHARSESLSENCWWLLIVISRSEGWDDICTLWQSSSICKKLDIFRLDKTCLTEPIRHVLCRRIIRVCRDLEYFLVCLSLGQVLYEPIRNIFVHVSLSDNNYRLFFHFCIVFWVQRYEN
jgi:hypothetical protein